MIKYRVSLKRVICRTAFVAVLCLFTLPTFAQDFLAEQVPVARKLADMDSLIFNKQITKERMEYPAMDIYPDWQNTRVHAYGNVKLPANYVVDVSEFCMPTTHTRITDSFGYRRWRRRMHYGLDVKVYTGDTIRAAFSGKIRMVRYERRGYGRYIVIRHDNGLETIYGHLSKQMVKENQYVDAGTPIGLGGNTGRSTGSHLHFEIRFLGMAINPASIFDFKKQDLVTETYTIKPSASPKARYYKVRSGDSLSRIASRQGVSISRLCKLNHISTRTTLRIGIVLRCS